MAFTTLYAHMSVFALFIPAGIVVKQPTYVARFESWPHLLVAFGLVSKRDYRRLHRLEPTWEVRVGVFLQGTLIGAMPRAKSQVTTRGHCRLTRKTNRIDGGVCQSLLHCA